MDRSASAAGIMQLHHRLRHHRQHLRHQQCCLFLHHLLGHLDHRHDLYRRDPCFSFHDCDFSRLLRHDHHYMSLLCHGHLLHLLYLCHLCNLCRLHPCRLHPYLGGDCDCAVDSYFCGLGRDSSPGLSQTAASSAPPGASSFQLQEPSWTPLQGCLPSSLSASSSRVTRACSIALSGSISSSSQRQAHCDFPGLPQAYKMKERPACTSSQSSPHQDWVSECLGTHPLPSI
mmetsp:Transcript_47184/g.112289  ORF Transcript_47184/g.112289 Transcript_47184/m.112289 type:complete len:230 (+) Transcript_47184:157-846(+)